MNGLNNLKRNKMTLKEKLIRFSRQYLASESELENLEQVADEFAIGFAEWCFRHYSEIPCEDTFELLEIYKEEKGL